MKHTSTMVKLHPWSPTVQIVASKYTAPKFKQLTYHKYNTVKNTYPNTPRKMNVPLVIFYSLLIEMHSNLIILFVV